MNPINITQIPKDVTLSIFDYLTPEQLGFMTRVCKQWNGLADDNSLWINIAKRIGLLEPFSEKDTKVHGGVKKEVFRRIEKINSTLHFSSKDALSLVCDKSNLIAGFRQTLRNIFDDCKNASGKISLARVIRCCKGDRNIVKAALESGAKSLGGALDNALLEAILTKDLEVVKTALKRPPRISLGCVKAAFATGDIAIIDEIVKKAIEIARVESAENPQASGERNAVISAIAIKIAEIVTQATENQTKMDEVSKEIVEIARKAVAIAGDLTIVDEIRKEAAKVANAKIATMALEEAKKTVTIATAEAITQKAREITKKSTAEAYKFIDMIAEAADVEPALIFRKFWESGSLAAEKIAEQQQELFNDAASSGNISVLKLAIKLGAIPNAHSFNAGVKSGNIKMVEFLKEQNLSINLASFNVALSTGKQDMIKLVQSLGGKPDKYSFESILLSRSEKMVEWFKKEYPKFVMHSANSLQRIISSGDLAALEMAIKNFSWRTASLQGLEIFKKLDSFNYLFRAIEAAMVVVNDGADPKILRIVLKECGFLFRKSNWGPLVMERAVLDLQNANITRILLNAGFASNFDYSDIVRLNDADLLMQIVKSKCQLTCQSQQNTFREALLTGNVKLFEHIFTIFSAWRILPVGYIQQAAFNDALRVGNVHLMEFLRLYITTALPSADSFNLAIQSAIDKKDIRILELAIEAGAKPDANTPLIAAKLENEPDFHIKDIVLKQLNAN